MRRFDFRRLPDAWRVFLYVLKGNEVVPRSPKENELIPVFHPDGPGGCTRAEIYYGESDLGTGGECPASRHILEGVMDIFGKYRDILWDYYYPGKDHYPDSKESWELAGFEKTLLLLGYEQRIIDKTKAEVKKAAEMKRQKQKEG